MYVLSCQGTYVCMYVCLVCLCLRAIVPASINAPWEFVNLNAYNSKMA